MVHCAQFQCKSFVCWTRKPGFGHHEPICAPNHVFCFISANWQHKVRHAIRRALWERGVSKTIVKLALQVNWMGRTGLIRKPLERGQARWVRKGWGRGVDDYGEWSGWPWWWVGGPCAEMKVSALVFLDRTNWLMQNREESWRGAS